MGDEPKLSGAALKWQVAARLKGYKCANCGAVPAYEDRQQFFETDLCSYCNYKSNDHTGRS